MKYFSLDKLFFQRHEPNHSLAFLFVFSENFPPQNSSPHFSSLLEQNCCFKNLPPCPEVLFLKINLLNSKSKLSMLVKIFRKFKRECGKFPFNSWRVNLTYSAHYSAMPASFHLLFPHCFIDKCLERNALL